MGSIIQRSDDDRWDSQKIEEVSRVRDLFCAKEVADALTRASCRAKMYDRDTDRWVEKIEAVGGTK